METPCVSCKDESYLRHTEYGTLVCTRCGVEDFGFVLSSQSAYSPYCVPLHSAATYTRIKRFRKYLQRASMEQSSASIPESTWSYLLAGCPYRSPGNIVRRLKKAPKHIRKKCYDSLPILVKNLCPHIDVPTLTEADKLCALTCFRKLDTAYNNGALRVLPVRAGVHSGTHQTGRHGALHQQNLLPQTACGLPVATQQNILRRTPGTAQTYR